MRVPSFWTPTGWWLFSGGDLKASASESLYCEELRRCERQTFDWRNTRTVYYRKWLVVPADWAGRRVTIDFQAVSSACVVYWNGAKPAATSACSAIHSDVSPCSSRAARTCSHYGSTTACPRGRSRVAKRPKR